MDTFLQQYADLIDTVEPSQPIDLYPGGSPHLKLYRPPANGEEVEQEKSRLKYNGINMSKSSNKVMRKYRFYVCGCECYALFSQGKQSSASKAMLTTEQRSRSRWRSLSTNTSSKEVSKAKKIAIRALYVLGYDLGVIDIGVRYQSPRYIVQRITSRIIPHKSLRDKLEKKLEEVRTEHVSPAKRIVLGADIEFVLRHRNGKYMLASKFFSKKGKIGYDAIWLRGHREKHPLVELRPSPDEDPKVMIQDLYQSMKKANRMIGNANIKWLAGGKPMKGYPIGGHIHFSGLKLEPRLIRALDNYLTLPLFLLESDTSLSRRPKYGFLGDFREQFHGGFEYRTPPSWIISPRITKGVIMLAKCIAEHYHEWSWMPLNQFQVQQHFYQGSRERIKPVVLELWEVIRQCSTYTRYEKELNNFYQLIINNEQWREYEDIRKAWRLPPYHKARPHQ